MTRQNSTTHKIQLSNTHNVFPHVTPNIDLLSTDVPLTSHWLQLLNNNHTRVSQLAIDKNQSMTIGLEHTTPEVHSLLYIVSYGTLIIGQEVLRKGDSFYITKHDITIKGLTDGLLLKLDSI